jgi:zeaxanthin glucosyltransferase
MRVVVISPPFYSHFQPLITVAKAFQSVGADVYVACSISFQQSVLTAGLRFSELEINRNANTRIAQDTNQLKDEAERIEAFIDATKHGPVATLEFQALHRQADMLFRPDQLQRHIAALHRDLQPDLYVVDQLSYGVTLSMLSMGLPFITFCPGHPTYIPTGDQRFGVPYAWPSNMQPSAHELLSLISIANRTERHFTQLFNASLRKSAVYMPVGNAFQVASSNAILFNYPDFGHLHQEPHGVSKYFLGSCFEPEELDSSWIQRLRRHQGRFKILISFGTFLSARKDVLERLIVALSRHYPDAVLYVSGGASKDQLSKYESDRIIIADFLPQTGLLPHVDLVVHHGGNNSFTETLYYGKPAIIMPFSSDQFAIAHDAEKFGLAAILDPNKFTEDQLNKAVTWTRQPEVLRNLQVRQASLESSGADAAAQAVLQSIDSRFFASVSPVSGRVPFGERTVLMPCPHILFFLP